MPVDGPVGPRVTDSVALGVHPRGAHSFRSVVTERLVEVLRSRSVAFDVVAEDGFVDRELHGVVSPAGVVELRFIIGRAENADVRIGEDESGGAIFAVGGGSGSLVGETQRPGIVTPADALATILARVGVEDGEPARIVERTDIAALRARLTRDAGVGRALAITSVAIGFSMLVLGAAARYTGRPDIAVRVAGAIVLVPLAYLLGLFIPSGAWLARAVPLLALPAAMLLPRVRLALVTAGFAALIGALTILAALRPTGEPALSLWGNPFESQRFFGLRNHLVAFIVGALILWIAAARPSTRAAVTASVSAAVLVGAPSLGANFGGVLTLVFGTAIAIMLNRGYRMSGRVLAIASVAALTAMALALLADTGTPVSHGGRAVRQVSDRGPAAVVQILLDRARLNWREVTDLDIVGYAGALVVVSALAGLLVWGVRRLPSPFAVAASAGTAAALLALISEDSGFFSAGIIGLYPAVAWLLAATGREGPEPAVPGTPAGAPVRTA